MLWQPTRGILQPGQHWRRGQVPVAATTTFNPSDKSAAITLSNGNLTATTNATSGTPEVRSIATAASGKLYCEVTFTAKATPGSENMALGVASVASHALTTYLGGDAASVGIWPKTGTSNVYFNNATGINYGDMTGGITGHVWAMAVDLGATKKFWWKNLTAATGWNNAVIGSQDPANNIGGYSPALTGSPWAICVETDVLNDAWTLNAGATAYTGTPPTGFVNW